VAEPPASPASDISPILPVSPIALDRREAAILKILAGEPLAEAIVRDTGVDRAELERLARLYRAAGRAAIADLKPDQ
jgi:hypothetical protein